MKFTLPTFSLILSAVMLIASAGANGQAYHYDTPNHEVLYVHLDKSAYVAGETINYKVYLADATDPAKMPCSRIVYFTLAGNGMETILWRINLTERSAAGSLTVPEDINEGMYVLTAYTNWMRNGPTESFYNQRIFITSLIKEAKPSVRIMAPQNKNDVISQASFSLKAETDQSSYKTGQVVRLTLSLEGNARQADVSVSVSAENPFSEILGSGNIVTALPVKSLGNAKPVVGRECSYPVEDRGFILSGRIISPTGNASLCDLWLSVADSNAPALLFTEINSTGEFIFYLDEVYDNRELILQLVESDESSDCRIELFSKIVQGDTSTAPHTLLPGEVSYLQTVKDIRLIEAVYGQKIEDTKHPAAFTRLNFLKSPDKVIVPSDYEEMRNFREIASNIIPEVRFGLRNDAFYLQVLSPAASWKDNRTVLLNGVPFTDLAYISTLGTKEIKRIDIYKSNILVGDLTLPGLVSIYTHDMMIPENYLRTKTVRYRNTVMESSSTMPDPDVQNEHYPGFTNCLYWDPFVSVSQVPGTIEFPTQMLKGRFNIRVQGLTGDGIPVSAFTTIEITD